MVPLSIDFYKLKEEIRKEIINRLERVEINNYSLNGAWLLYALSFEDRENSIFFDKGLNELEKWALSEVSGLKDKDLAPLSLCGYLSAQENIKTTIIKKVGIILTRALPKSETKFNVLNDPEQIFCVSLLKDKIDHKVKDQLVEVIKKNLSGRIARKVLFTAALFEFGKDVEGLGFKSIEDAEDIITVLWLYERYRKKTKGELLPLWRAFEKIYPSTEKSYISNMALAFLYESVTFEIKEPDPNMLFDLFPLHSEIKKNAKYYFKNKKYVAAISESAKKLNDFIQSVSGITNKSEAELVQATMKQIKDPIIQFNEYLEEDSGKNEQSGLALIAEGIFKAFRNPKGHKPEDHPLLEMNPYEAIEQLIVIDYIWKRIDKARIKRK